MIHPILILEGKEAATYMKWLITINKLFRQGQCTHFVMIGSRYFSMSTPTIYPDSKFLSEIEINIPQFVGVRRDKELQSYMDLCAVYPQLIHHTARILFDSTALFEYTKIVKPTKLKNIVFYGNGGIDRVVLTDIEDRELITPILNESTLTTNIPRFIYSNSNMEYKLKNSYGEEFSLIGSGTVDHKFFELIFNHDIPLDMIFDKDSISISGNNGSIEYEWTTNDEFDNQKRIFISRQMIPKIMNDELDTLANISVFVENISQKYYILRVTSFINTLGIMISSDSKIVMI